MTSCSLQRQPQQPHHAKFRWTEKLTCRFIQLRRDHAKMFTGRKYSAQQGWEYILRQMRQEFPVIMTDVHYRVLKKKWSNLLQQYKELKNPVHGDKNHVDDISWPFYAAIDEVIASLSADKYSQGSSSRRRRGASCINDDDENIKQEKEEEEEEEEDGDLNPQEFLCVSVQSPDDVAETTTTTTTTTTTPIDYERLSAMQPLDMATRRPPYVLDSTKNTRRSSSEQLLSRLPSATELTIRPAVLKRQISRSNEEEEEDASNTGPMKKKSCRQQDEGLERRFVEFMEYSKRRHEENRSILMRMLEALEDIRNALR